MTFLDPTNDVAFRKIFGNEKHTEPLVSLLNATLNLEGEKQIDEVSILNPFQAPKIVGLKESILDISCKDKKGRRFIVEMQLIRREGLEKRLLYYASKNYVNQLPKGKGYIELQPVFMVVFTGFNFTKSDGYYSRHLVLNAETREHLLTDVEFVFIELPKFDKHEKELRSLIDKWVFFFKNAGDLHEVPEPLNVEPIKQALDELKEFKWTEQEMEIYEKNFIYQTDEIAARMYSEKIGRMEGIAIGKAEGKAEGITEGKAEGIAEGKAEGKVEVKTEVIINGRKMGLSDKALSQLTGLTIEEIKNIDG